MLLGVPKGLLVFGNSITTKTQIYTFYGQLEDDGTIIHDLKNDGSYENKLKNNFRLQHKSIPLKNMVLRSHVTLGKKQSLWM